MFVIGTAGHVDHGKSTLIEALTGIDPDRLAEEKAREMTIDLGFAWIVLGQDEEVGIIDVPGHRDFIENMLAGIGGIDLALFVVAADEGVMPQTQEHLAILDLLEVHGGVVALTKVDMIDDPDWLELVTLDLDETLSGTALAGCPIVPVSAKTGAGLDVLKEALWQQLQKARPRPDKGRPRLPVDRVFSLSGFGTIVTGTLLDGTLTVGDQVELQPSGVKGRIRGLQTHKTKRTFARPGSRVAVNLSGMDRVDVNRGEVLAAPGTLRSTILLDVAYRHLLDAGTPLKHNMEVKLFVGSAEVLGRTRVLGQAQIDPGKEGWLQIALGSPIAVLRGDRFILRRPSPGTTLGGGVVLDPFPGRRHKRFRSEIIERLKTLSQGTPAELLLQALQRIEPVSEDDLMNQSGLDEAAAKAALLEIDSDQQIVRFGKQLISRTGWQQKLDAMTKTVGEFHSQFPLRKGMSREELRSRMKLPAAVFNPLVALAAENSALVEDRALVHIPGHEIAFSPTQLLSIAALEASMRSAGISSPSIKEVKGEIGEEVYFALIDLGQLIPLNNDIVYSEEIYRDLIDRVRSYLQSNSGINAAQTRDLLNTSRKYAIALLEHLDDIKLTRRVGDDRQLIIKPSQ